MAIAFQSAQFAGSDVNPTSLVVTKPTSLAVGDLMVGYCVHTHNGGSVGSITLPTGFTSSETNVNATNTVRATAGYKVADSSDVAASNFTFSLSGPNIHAGFATIIRITGADVSIHAPVTSSGIGSSSSLNTPGITPADADSIILLFAAQNTSSGGKSMSGYTITTSPPTFNEIFDAQPDGYNPLLLNSGGAWGIRSQVTATSGSTVTSTSSGNYVSIIMSISPQAGTLYTQECTEDINLTSTLIKTTSKVLSNGVVFTGSLLKISSRIISENLKLTGTLIKTSSRILNESLKLTGTFIGKVVGRVMFETLKATDTVIRSSSRTLSQVLVLTDTLSRVISLNYVINETVRITCTVIKTTGKVVSDTLNIGNVLEIMKSLSTSFTESVILTSAITSMKMLFRELSENIVLGNIIDFIFIPFGVFRKRPNGSMSKRSIGGSSNQISSKSGSINRNNQKMGSISRMSTKTGKMSR